MSEHALLEPLLLRLPEVAQVLAVSTSYVEELVASGQLQTVAFPAARGGPSGRPLIRVRLEDVRAWVQAQADRSIALQRSR